MTIKLNFAFLILIFASFSQAEESFDDVLKRKSTKVDFEEMAKSEEALTRAAVAKKTRMDLGLDFKDGEWKSVIKATVKSDEEVFRFNQDKIKVENEEMPLPQKDSGSAGVTLPKVVAVYNSAVRLQYDGKVSDYKQGDKIGLYFVERISVHEVELRDVNSKRYTLRTDW